MKPFLSYSHGAIFYSLFGWLCITTGCQSSSSTQQAPTANGATVSTSYVDGDSIEVVTIGNVQYLKGFETDSALVARNMPAKPTPPTDIIWLTLLSLKFDVSFDAELGEALYKPLFTPPIRLLEGRTITLEGYLIPMQEAGLSEQFVMFSAYPYASCFFCGGAGPESVLQAYPKRPIPHTDQKIKMRGQLQLNSTDLMSLPYLLHQAEIVP